MVTGQQDLLARLAAPAGDEAGGQDSGPVLASLLLRCNPRDRAAYKATHQQAGTARPKHKQTQTECSTCRQPTPAATTAHSRLTAATATAAATAPTKATAGSGRSSRSLILLLQAHALGARGRDALPDAHQHINKMRDEGSLTAS